jgi:hypothetical protein
VHILDPSLKLQLLRKWDKGIDINPEKQCAKTTPFQEVLLIYVEN